MLEAAQPQLRTFHSQQIFTSLNKMPAASLKLMTLLHAQICRALRSLSRAKSFLLDVLRNGHPVRLIYCGECHHNGKRNAAYYGSFRLHYNWCSSRSFSIPNSVALDGLRPNYLQYDAATWNVAAAEEEDSSAGLSGYLRWLEERKTNIEKAPSGGGSEIDELADAFITKCREKFVLEKQESDRRFQEMLARSI